MALHIRTNPIFFLLLVSIFFTACNGQTKPKQTTDLVVKQLSFTSKKAKLTKTQGTNAYQNIHCSLQDKDGNLWFGTSGEGVYRYDGKEFTQFTETDGLSNNSVWSILEDRLGNIWFGTSDGVSQYDGKTLSKTTLTMVSSSGLPMPLPQSGKNIVWSLFQDKSGIIWIGSDDGLYCYDGKTFTYFLDRTTILNRGYLTLKGIQCMFEDTKGNMWFGSGPQATEGICLFDGKSLTNFKPQGEGWIRKIIENKDGLLLFATRHFGVMAYDGKTLSHFSVPQNLRQELVTALLRDRKGDIWYGSDYTNDNDPAIGGLWKFDGKSFIEFTTKDGLSNTSVFSLTEDKAGKIWIGTRNCGLYRYNGKAFETFSE